MNAEKRNVMAWHFTGATLRDGRAVPAIGETLRHEGRLRICESGLHASVDPFDALQYAPGPLLHRVRCDGVSRSREALKHSDKLVCRERTIVASIDATALLRRFARDQAIEALGASGVTPPEIVAEYLRTGEERKRAAAWVAARDAADAAASAAASAAAWAAAVSAWVAADVAAWAAARAAARDDFNARVALAFAGTE